MQYPDSTWRSIDQSKWLYVVLMVFLGIVGTLAFVIVARPALRRATLAPVGQRDF